MTDTIVILLLAALPMTNPVDGGSKLDRDALVAQAGCHGVARITIAEHDGVDAKWLVTVRCSLPRVPVAEILRAEPYEAPRRVQGCVRSPFAGWCADGSKRP